MITNVLIIIFAIGSLTNYALPIGSPACYEQINGTHCGLLQHPFDAVLVPFQFQFGVFFFVIFWGVEIGIIWLSSRNINLTAIVGIMIAFAGASFLDKTSVGVGYMLIAVVIAVTLYQLFRVRLDNPV